MKKLLIKIAIGIVAVPTVVLGTLYVTREIPFVSQYVVKPMAQLSQSLGIPVIIMPGDNYFKEEAKERYEAAVNLYNRISDKEELVINEEQAKGYNSEGVSIYQNYNAGVSYAELQIKPYEQFEKEWVEYSKEFYKNNYANITKEDINKAQEEVNNASEKMEKQKKLSELYKELQNAQMNKDEEKEQQIKQQIEELENQ